MKTPLCLVFTFLCVIVYGQDQTQLPLPEIPLTPEAAAFAKYGDIPVSHATGIANIYIPIYEVKLKDYSLPIGLRYHSGGFKVDEIASDVGLGWTLEGYGMISQSIRGLRDHFDGSSGYASKADILTLVDQDNTVTGTGFKVCDTGDACGASFLSDIGHQPTNQDNIYFGHADSEPDQFHFNLPGLNGMFFINKQGQFVTNKASRIKIEYEQVNDRFVIRDEQGIAYTFQDKEILTTESSCEGASLFYTPRMLENFSPNYYLTTICLPQGGCLHFEYNNYSYKYTTGITQTDFHPGSVSTCYDEVTIKEGKKISRIYTDTGISVDFNYGSSQRPDLPSALNGLKSGKLESVVINAAGNEVTRYSLVHEVTNGATNAHLSQFITPSDANHTRRLMLKSVQQTGKNPYTLEYMSDPDWGSARLPSRFSFAKDYWGYYNGEETNDTMVPASTFFGVGLGTADRTPDAQHMQANLIKKINYPPGGFSLFHFEPHQRTIVLNPGSNGCTEVIENRSVSMASIGDEGPTSEFFAITDNSFNIWVDYTTNVPADNTTQFDPVFGEPFSSCFIKDQVTFQSPQQGPLSLPVGTHELVLRTAGLTDQRDENMDFIPSQTSITITWKERVLNCPQDALPVSKTVLYGGLRVASIDGCPDQNGCSQPSRGEYKYFEYKYPLINNDIYENATGLATHDYHYFNSYRISSTAPGNCSLAGSDPYYSAIGDSYTLVYSVSSGPTRPLAYAGGGSVKYREVAEVTGISDELIAIPGQGGTPAVPLARNIFGKTVFTFDHYPNVQRSPGSVYTEDDYSWLGGDIDIERHYVYRSGTNDFQLVRQRSFYYTVHDLQFSGSNSNYQEVWGLKVSRTHQPFIKPSGVFCREVVPRYASSFYRIPSVWKTLDRVVEKVYDGSGITAQTSNAYNATTLQLAAQHRSQDALQTQSTYYVYAPDLLADGAVYVEMNNKNMAGVPVYVVNTRERVNDPGVVPPVISEYIVRVQHLRQEIAGQNIRLTSLKESELEQPQLRPSDQSGFTATFLDNILSTSSRETFLTYNTFGNVIQVEQNGEHKAYLWDTNELNPIAEATNAGSDQVYHTSFENNGTTGASKTGNKYWPSGTYSIPVTPTGSNLKMSYWYWTGSAWIYSGELDFNATINSGGSRLDEVRVYPKDAVMTTYTYQPGVGVTSITDHNGLTHYYDYDPANRLEVVSDNDQNLVNKFDYNQRIQN